MAVMFNQEYRVLLGDLHCELSDDNVKALKFLAQPLIKKRDFEKIQDGITFFEALENIKQLSPTNLVFLHKLLGTIRRLDLQAKFIHYPDANFDGEICPFRILLLKLRDEISDEDLGRMRYLSDKIRKRDTIKDPLDFFTILIQDQCLAPDKWDHLLEILKHINRYDLCEEITDFRRSVRPQDCGYPHVFRKERSALYREASIEGSGSRMQPMSSPVEDSLDTFSNQSMTYNSGFVKASIESTGNGIRSLSLNDRSDQFQESNAPWNQSHVTTEIREERESEALTISGQSAKTLTAIREESYGGACGSDGSMSMDTPDTYKMDAIPRGTCLIIDLDMFTHDPHDPEAVKLEPRPGSSIDRGKLQRTFRRLHFQTCELLNKTASEIMTELERLSTSDHWSADCLVICILSHGGLGHFFGSDGRQVQESEITRLFSAQKCPSLADKPKLFFFSYCRGRDHELGVPLSSLQTDSPNPNNMVADGADFLFGYATIPDKVAYRSSSRGTFYIDVLTEVLDREADRTELQHILLKVNRKVAERDYKKTYKQIPRPEHSLRRQLYFL